MANRIYYFVALLTVAWCVMTITHELGHIVGGSLCGGKLIDFDLLPWRLPYSIFSPDPVPIVTLWCRPILGVIAPLVIAMFVRRDWMTFVADFCIIANGMYIGTAWLSNDRYLDTTKLLAHGAHPASLLTFVSITIGFGYIRFRNSCIGVLSEPKSGEREPSCESKPASEVAPTHFGKSQKESD